MNANDPSFWLNYWETDNVKWHAPVVSPWLVEFKDKFLPSKKGLRVLVPLCGKTVDMKWLIDKGCHVSSKINELHPGLSQI